MRGDPATQSNRRLTNTEPQNIDVNPVPSRLSLFFFCHDSELCLRSVVRFLLIIIVNTAAENAIVVVLLMKYGMITVY
jgi:hypothetical protein